MSWNRMSKSRFLEEARRLVTLYGGGGRLAKSDENVGFSGYAFIPAVWSDEKRLVILLLQPDGSVYTVIAPPVPSPFCVTMGASEISESVRQVLAEIGSRYVSWCVVIYPPAYRPSSLIEAVKLLIELEILDDVGGASHR